MRHRASKLLLRHGIVYSGAKAWTCAREACLLKQHFDYDGTQQTITGLLGHLRERGWLTRVPTDSA